MSTKLVLFTLLLFSFITLGYNKNYASEISDNTYLITDITSNNYNNNSIWNYLRDNETTGVKLKIDLKEKTIVLSGSSVDFTNTLLKIESIIDENESKIIPVFLNYSDNISILDSIIKSATISNKTFYLPQGEAWPSTEYLVEANRRIIFFVEGEFDGESKILHDLKNYVLKISANQLASSSVFQDPKLNSNLELLMVENLEKLPANIPRSRTDRRNLAPEYINYLLETWKKYGKKPNFISLGKAIFNFDFITDQLNSFSMIKGKVRNAGKYIDKVYWKSPDILITGGKFNFPFRGGEEVTLSPYAPGFKMTPEQIIVTSEMAIPESYSIIANPLNLSEGMTSKFEFDEIILDALNPTQTYTGENYSFVQDIERGSVLRLPEKASINLGNPELYGLRNSSFTVSCFVKFTEILEFGDNAILGNHESGYRKGLHLVLRSGQPYFGLWANDFISNETLKPNVWYHMAWRYNSQTGEQAIILNGKNIGSSNGHPPFSGTEDIQLGSALSASASLRGYIDNLYMWNRPLGIEEINRLYLDETIEIEQKTTTNNLLITLSRKWLFIIVVIIVAFLFALIVIVRVFKKNKDQAFIPPVQSKNNQVLLFGEFKAINSKGETITDLFTPKVRELFIIILIYTLRNEIGAEVSKVNEKLWPGISSKKVANNRSVTLNKLRRILFQFDGIEIISTNGYLQMKIERTFFCDFADAFYLCQIPEGMSKRQLVSFFHLVKRGRFLKGITWDWLDNIRGFTGNQVIDNLLKLATIYKKENNLKEVEKVAQRILDYDDLNEEAIYFQLWALQEANSLHLAKFNFKTFASNYKEFLGEEYSMTFDEFLRFYGDRYTA